MSLQVWLPLNGSAINQGVAEFQPAATNITYTTGGKITSQCYTSGEIYMSTTQSSQILNNNAITIAFWINPQDAATSSNIFGWSNQQTGVRQFSLFQYHGSNANKHGTTLHWSWDFTLGAGENYDTNGNYLNTSSASTITDALPVKQWTHVCITYSNPTFKAYINGQLRAVRTGTANYTFNQVTPIIHNNGNRYINDFRIYDHCLSPREVKLLAQGLVAHYKLDGLQLTNLAPGDHGFEGETWGGVSTTTLHSYGGHKSLYLKKGTTVAYQTGFTKPIVNHKYYGRELIKTDGNVTVDDCRFEIYGGDGAGKNWVFASNRGNFPQWSINSGIVTIDSTTVDSYGVRTFVVNSSADIFIDNMLIVDLTAAFGVGNEPSKEWCDNNIPYFSGTFGKSSAIDCSGYGNHGTPSATLEASTDSPRYSHSTVFNNNKWIRNSTVNTNGWTDITVSAWVNPISFSNGSDRMCIVIGGVYLVINAEGIEGNHPVGAVGTWCYGKNPTGYFSTSKTIPLNQWSHLVAVWNNDTNTHKIYINGIEEFTTTCSGTAGDYEGHAKKDIGRENGNDRSFNGKISDVRIYATALSAAAIKELYQSSISFLDNGTLQCSEIVENPTNLKYNQNGIVQGEQFNEYPSQCLQTRTLSDGSRWARIHYLDISRNMDCFTNAEEADCCVNQDNRFSLTKFIHNFYNQGYEFMLTYDKPCVVPEGYTQLEYLEASGVVDNRPYINTGVYTNGTTKIVVKAYGDGNTSIYGSGSTYPFTNVTGGGNYFYYYYGASGQGRSNANNAHSTPIGSTYYFKQEGPECYINNDLVHTFGQETFTSAGTMYLFGRYTNDSGTLNDAGGTVRIYSCAIWNAGVLIRNLIPAKRNSDNILGMYDIVNNVFYTNAGSGTFSAGAEISRNSSGNYNRWAQDWVYDTINQGDNAVITVHTDSKWASHRGPLKLANTSNRTLYDCDNKGTTNWWAAIGQYNPLYEGGIPAANQQVKQYTELWVRIPSTDNIKFLTNSMQTYQIYEL